MKRVFRTKNEKEQLVDDFNKSGMSKSSWCREHGIPVSTLNDWLYHNCKKCRTEFPVCTNWISITMFAAFSVTVYILVMLFTTLSYILLHHILVKTSERKEVREGIRLGRKEWASVLLEIVALILSMITPIRWTCLICMLLMTPLWLIPDLRILWYLSEKAQDEE